MPGKTVTPQPEVIFESPADIVRQPLDIHAQGESSRAARARSFSRADAEHIGALGAIAASALQRGDYTQAVSLYDELILFEIEIAEVHYKRANALNALGRWDEAVSGYDRAIELRPEFAYAYCNRGVALERLLRWDQALESYERAVFLNPSDSLAYYNRGSVLRSMTRLEQALDSYNRAIALNPEYGDAYINRGNVLQGLQQHAAAVESYETAIRLNATRVEAHVGRGVCLAHLKLHRAARSSFESALRLDTKQKFLPGMRRMAQMHICDWTALQSDREFLIDAVRAGRPVCAPLTMLALVDAPSLHKRAALTWMQTESPPNDSLGEFEVRPRRDKIKIAYFSADFRNHPVALLTAQLFEEHDRSKFEITAFAFGPQAGDAMRQRLERGFDRFIDVRSSSDVEIARLAREIGIDIAVDLGGFTEHSRTSIFALRAAPVQVSYIGYLGTMSAPYIDYLVADATLIPKNQRENYAEKIVFLPSYQVNDSHRRPAERVFTREELRLPPTGFVFSCFNANYKIMPESFATWMRILRRVQGSALFLYVDDIDSESNLRKEALRCGIDPQRIVFGGRLGVDEYLARYRTMDLFLDTLPYNAGTTASDALRMCVPVVTCAGQSFASRYAASLLRAMDLPELITETPFQYEELAVELATDPQRLARLKHKMALNRKSTALFDTVRFTRNLEAAYLKIYERSARGQLPDDITIWENSVRE